MNRNELEEWASAYIAAQKAPTAVDEYHPQWWAIEKFMLPTPASAGQCWDCILEIVSRNPPENVLAMLAAGPIEDLLHYHGREFIDRLEDEARKNPLFRTTLQYVWPSGQPEMWARLERYRQ